MLQFEHVTKRYETGHEALSDVNFMLDAGEFAFLTGPSGAGKSTLLKLIMAIELATRGKVVVNGQSLEKIARRRIPALRRQIGFVFQNHHLLFDRSVFENVALPLYIQGTEPREVARKVSAALSKVGLHNKAKHMPIGLSGGEQQRVGIARAVVTRPPVLLADEPTGNLDPALSEEIMGVFELFQQVGVTVLIATHDVAFVERSPHRRLHLVDGRFEEGSTS